MNTQLSQDANNLKKTLKGENKTQENWGEVVLQNIMKKLEVKPKKILNTKSSDDF